MKLHPPVFNGQDFPPAARGAALTACGRVDPPSLHPRETGALLDLMYRFRHGQAWEPPKSCDPRSLWNVADRHGLGGIIGWMAQAGGMGDEFLAAPGKARYFSNLVHYEKCRVVIRTIQTAAANAGIRFFVLKGPTLAHHAYKEPGIRTFTDLDLIVPSRADAFKLHSALRETLPEAPSGRPLQEKRSDPGKFHFPVQGISVEVHFPGPIPYGPALDMMQFWRSKLFDFDRGDVDPLSPDPALHFCYLCIHLATHFGFRLSWILDIALLAHEKKAEIDMGWVCRELERLQMANTTAIASEFCRAAIDPDFPLFMRASKGWNTAFQERQMTPEIFLSGGINKFQKSLWGKISWIGIEGACYFLITDPGRHTIRRACKASSWTTAFFLSLIRMPHAALQFILQPLVFLAMCPYSRLWALAMNCSWKRFAAALSAQEKNS